MIRNKFTNTRLGNAAFFAPVDMASAFDTVITYLHDQIPVFRNHQYRTSSFPRNERAITELLTRHLIGYSKSLGANIIFQSESMEDLNKGNSAAVDIGVFWVLHGQPSSRWPRISAMEAKRLDSSLPQKREREYVIGHTENGNHVPCGGMERYKKEIHGADLQYKAILIGYMQTDNYQIWKTRINSWITNLIHDKNQFPSWIKAEQIGKLKQNNIFASSESNLHRKNDSIILVHLWINLVKSVTSK